MPTIRIELFEGRTPEQKRDLAKAITDATCQVLGSSPDGVDILFFDIRKRASTKAYSIFLSVFSPK